MKTREQLMRELGSPTFLNPLKVALVILTRNRDDDFKLVQRLLGSLEKTDFPRTYCVFLVVDSERYPNDGSVPTNRNWALSLLAEREDFDWIVYMHNDVYFTGNFWNDLVALGKELVLIDPVLTGVDVHCFRTECFAAMTRGFLRENLASVERVLANGDPRAAYMKTPISHKD